MTMTHERLKSLKVLRKAALIERYLTLIAALAIEQGVELPSRYYDSPMRHGLVDDITYVVYLSRAGIMLNVSNEELLVLTPVSGVQP